MTVIIPILHNSCELWGYENLDIIEKVSITDIGKKTFPLPRILEWL